MNQWQRIVRFLFIRLAIYLAAVAVTYILASIAATQFVVSSLKSMGIVVSVAERVSMTVSDLAGMAGLFLPMIAFGLLIAFMVTALICKYWSRRRVILYIISGAVALVSIHLALNLAFGITPIAVARTIIGLSTQALAGAAGGLFYVWLSQTPFARME
jgi:hypothetical protein